MGLKDRTRDFRELADGCQQAQKDVSLRKPSLSHSSQPSRPKAFTTRFAIEADQIGKSLQETMNKLKNLRSLTMDNGIFIDRTSKIDKLTFEIKYDITNLTKKSKESLSLSTMIMNRVRKIQTILWDPFKNGWHLSRLSFEKSWKSEQRN